MLRLKSILLIGIVFSALLVSKYSHGFVCECEGMDVCGLEEILGEDDSHDNQLSADAFQKIDKQGGGAGQPFSFGIVPSTRYKFGLTERVENYFVYCFGRYLRFHALKLCD